MKNVNTKLMALAGTLALAATAVYAQVSSPNLKASIPFSFQVGSGRTMQAGDYRISHSGSAWSFTNAETREQARLLPTSSVQGKFGESASLVFECRANGSNCSLRTIHAGGGSVGAYWPSPKGNAEGGEVAQIVVVPVTATAE